MRPIPQNTKAFSLTAVNILQYPQKFRLINCRCKHNMIRYTHTKRERERERERYLQATDEHISGVLVGVVAHGSILREDAVGQGLAQFIVQVAFLEFLNNVDGLGPANKVIADIEDEVGRILVFGTLEAQSLEECQHSREISWPVGIIRRVHRTEIHHFTSFAEQQQMGEHGEDLFTRLMDCADDRFALSSNCIHRIHYLIEKMFRKKQRG